MLEWGQRRHNAGLPRATDVMSGENDSIRAMSRPAPSEAPADGRADRVDRRLLPPTGLILALARTIMIESADRLDDDAPWRPLWQRSSRPTTSPMTASGSRPATSWAWCTRRGACRSSTTRTASTRSWAAARPPSTRTAPCCGSTSRSPTAARQPRMRLLVLRGLPAVARAQPPISPPPRRSLVPVARAAPCRRSRPRGP